MLAKAQKYLVVEVLFVCKFTFLESNIRQYADYFIGWMGGVTLFLYFKYILVLCAYFVFLCI